MSRLLNGILLGLAAAAMAAAALWWGGMLHIGMMAGTHDGQAMAADGPMAMPSSQGEHAGHEMPAAAASGQEAAMDEHAEHEGAAATGTADATAMPEGAVMITPERQQLIGVRTAPVTRENLVRTIRTVGRVEYDETRVAHIHTKISGWIEELYVDFTGKLVQKSQPLLEIYSPELVATQEEYLLALRAQDSLGSSSYPEVSGTTRSLLEATRRRLLLWDVTPAQIAALEERREPQTTLTLYSPIEGYVIHKTAYEGQHVGPNSEMFTIADLSNVWVIAEIYESELPLVRIGQRAKVSLSYLPGQTFDGVVDYIYPYLAGETRTAEVRLVLENHDATLKPAMYANVEMAARLGNSLVVPEDAVIDTGQRQVVFLALGDGHFLPREVQAGLRFDGKLQILEGLAEGDIVVSGAAFLVDSETKLRSSLRGMAGHQH